MALHESRGRQDFFIHGKDCFIHGEILSQFRTRFVIVLLPSNRGRLLGIIFIDLMIQNKKNET